MVEYVPKTLSVNHNVSPRSPLYEFVLLVIGICASITVVVVLISIVVDIIVRSLSIENEQRFCEWLRPKIVSLESRHTFTSAINGVGFTQGVLDRLSTHSSFGCPIKVFVIEMAEENALALPGGVVVISRSLLKNVESENELAFVLAHEVGHFEKRHHLTGIGRGVGVTVLALIFGRELHVPGLDLLLGSLGAGYSREAEREADDVAIKLVTKEYGHLNGATRFFERMAKSEGNTQLDGIFRSHPYSIDRVHRIESVIETEKLPSGELRPLPADWFDSAKSD